VPESACPHWRGTPRNYPDDEGDYGRACAVEDYIGLIDVGPAQALVLGDDQARTTFLPEHGVLFREVARSDDLDPTTLVAEQLPAIEWNPSLTWKITEPLILFDSAYDYPHLVDANEEHLRIDLSPGRYIAEATYLESLTRPTSSSSGCERPTQSGWNR
jgi:hypothetical protein